MKIQKLLITIIMIMALLLIGVGIAFSLPKQEKEKVYKENREYKLIITQPEKTLADHELTKEDFGKIANDIGFEDVVCHQTLCVATHDTYKEKDYKDKIQLEQDPEGNKMYIITLYFHKNDYSLENMHNQLNNIVPNFAGVKITEEQLNELQEIYKQGKINQASKTYQIGPYTMELLIKKVEDKDFYEVRFKFVSTSLFN